MNNREYKNADIIRDIVVNNVYESNRLLRKFYDEVSKYIKIGWHYAPYREERIIYVGDSTFGRMWLEYERKGIIKRIYISTESEQVHDIIDNALDNAISGYKELKTYIVRVTLKTGDIGFRMMCKNKIHIESVLVEDDKYNTMLTFSINAYGKFD